MSSASVFLAAAVFTAVFGLSGILRYRQYAYPDYDFTINIQKYWSILHSDGRISFLGDADIFGNSFEIIAYPMSAVYMALFQSREALLVLQPLMIACAALVLFKITKEIVPEGWAACISVSYLLNPGIWNTAVGQYYDVNFCAVPLLSAFYFLRKGRFAGYILSLAAALLFRADIALIVLMFGVYAFFDRKPRKWALVPAAMGLAWASAYLFLVRPLAVPKINYEAFYAGPAGMISALFSADNARLAFQLLAPLVFIPLLSLKELMIPLLVLARQAVSTNFQHHRMILHYPSLILPFFYVSAAFGLKKVLNTQGPSSAVYRKALPALILLAAVSTNLWFGPLNKAGSYLLRVKEQESARKIDALISRIPADASVITTFSYSSHLANRRHLYSFHTVTDGPSPFPYEGYRLPADINYALVNFSDTMISSGYSNAESDRRIRDFFSSGGWEVLDSVDSTVLLMKGRGNGPLYVSGGRAEGRKPVVSADNIALLWYDAKPDGDFIDIGLLWECRGAIDDDIFVLLRLVGPGGEEVYRGLKHICYGVYPTYRWEKGETVSDRYRFFIPERRAPRGKAYSLRMSLVSARRIDGMRLAPSGTAVLTDGGKEMVIGEYGR